MDEANKPTEVQPKKPRSRARIAVMIVFGLIIFVILVLALDTFGPRGISYAVDRVGVLPVCVYDQGDCKPCFGPSCLSQLRGTPSPCAGISDFSAQLDCEMNTAKPPSRTCHRIFGFMCTELRPGPE